MTNTGHKMSFRKVKKIRLKNNFQMISLDYKKKDL